MRGTKVRTGSEGTGALAKILRRLRDAFGAPEPPAIRDPFAVVIWENCAYLVDDDKRAAVFRALERRVGVEPSAIASAPPALLGAILEPGGMRCGGRVEKIQRASAIAMKIGVEELRLSVKRTPEQARKLLKRFPGIGDPGADKILLLAGSKATFAPDSNALRVAQRLGYGEVARDYGRSYRSSVEAVAAELPADCKILLEAHGILRQHGQTICRRTAPRCEACPVTDRCRYYARHKAPSGS
jgi:endonuclease III